MMRSLFSGVSGLKTHQTRMDVIGNNIANVNTTAYKSQNMVFSDLLYQTTQAASGANAATGRGGINARQIGLGSKTAAINTAITRQGSAQSTNNPWDIMITGEAFFIVNSGSQNFFTRDGAFTIDGAGNLVMASTGYRVMGWQVDEETGDIRSDVVSALQIMNRDNLFADAEYTTMAYGSGILDKNDTDVKSSGGKVMTLNFFDALGYQYTAKMSVHSLGTDGDYYVQLDDIINGDGESLKDYYNVSDISQIATFGGAQSIPETKVYGLIDGAHYDDATKTYTVEYSYDEILENFSNSVMLGIADAKGNLSVESIKGTSMNGVTASQAIAVGDAVLLKGSVALSSDVLESDYGLIYENGKYYYKDASGATQPLDTTAASQTPWETILSQMAGGNAAGTTVPQVKLAMAANGTDPDITIDSATGEVTLSFTAELKAKEAGTYDPTLKVFGTTLTYPTDHDQILEKAYGLFNTENTTYAISYVAPGGSASIEKVVSYDGNALKFDTKTGKFEYIGSQDQKSATLTFNGTTTDMTGAPVDLGHFSNISIDFSSITNVNNGGVSTAGLDSGDGSSNNLGAGRKYGELIGVEIGQDGKIRASYDNGLTRLLGQIAVAKFANASGLAKSGNNLYSTTMNSGDFDGIGQDITADGEGSMESGLLEMSNVDLAAEFTEMITTQRGFQANSRIITTSDTLLEELVNLKR